MSDKKKNSEGLSGNKIEEVAEANTCKDETQVDSIKSSSNKEEKKEPVNKPKTKYTQDKAPRDSFLKSEIVSEIESILRSEGEKNKSEIANLKDQIEKLIKKEVEGNDGKIRGLKEELSSMASEVRGGLEGLKNDLKAIRSNKKSLETKLDEIIDEEFPSVSKMLKSIIESVGEIEERVEPLSAKLNTLEDGVGIVNQKLIDLENSQVSSNIPKDKQSIINLVKMIKDGLEELEHIGSCYVDKQLQIDEFDRREIKLEEEQQKEEERILREAKKEEEKEWVKKIYERFPSEFDKISSVFPSVSKKYEPGEEIMITKENQEVLSVSIEGIGGLKAGGSLKIMEPGLCLGDDVLRRATVEK